MSDRQIRARAVGVCVREGRLFVEHGYDRTTGERFYRVIGGAIEFGERAAAAVQREWREELGVDIGDVRLLGVLENLYVYEGQPGHQVVFVFDAAATDDALLTGDREFIEADGQRHRTTWVPLAEFEAGAARLYPEGLLDLLRGSRR